MPPFCAAAETSLFVCELRRDSASPLAGAPVFSDERTSDSGRNRIDGENHEAVKHVKQIGVVVENYTMNEVIPVANHFVVTLETGTLHTIVPERQLSSTPRSHLHHYHPLEAGRQGLSRR